MGEEIAMLVNQLQDSGQHSVVWEGKDSSEGLVNPGVYVYKIQIMGKYKIIRCSCSILRGFTTAQPCQQSEVDILPVKSNFFDLLPGN